MKKADALEEWKRLEPNQPILPVMTPIPYTAKGSKYGACGIRIDGNPAFVNAVLSRLKDIIEGESGLTRLQFSRSRVNNVLDKHFANREAEAECVYIRLCERGSSGKTRRIIANGTRARRKIAAACTGVLGL